MTDDDLIDAWSTLSEGTGCLWCHGVMKSAKQLDSSGEESDILDEPPLKKVKTRRVYMPEDKQASIQYLLKQLYFTPGTASF